MRKSLLLGTLALAALATGRSHAAVLVVQPNGGEVLPIGTSYTIKWSGASTTSTSRIRIQISRNGGTTWTDIVSNLLPNNGGGSGGSGNYAWTVTGDPAPPVNPDPTLDALQRTTSQARIRVINTNGGTTQDDSNADFTISKQFADGTFSIQNNGSFTIRLNVAKRSPNDPNGSGYTYKYIYTLINLDPNTSLPNSYLRSLLLSNCSNPFAAIQPKKANGTNADWSVPTGTEDIFWIANGAVTANGVPPNTFFTFCVYTNRSPVLSTIVVSSLHTTDGSHYTVQSSNGVDYYTPGCTQAQGGIPLPVGCEHEYHMAQAYPVAVSAGGFIVCDCFDIPDLSCWRGATAIPIVGTGVCATERLALPGLLCLKTDENDDLDVNAFVTTGEDGCAVNPFVQSVSLTKVAAFSPKCPDIFHGYTITQTGASKIRTAWPLAYTTPGTTFTLTLMGEDRSLDGQTVLGPYTESWVWTVVANADTFCHLIDLFHTNTLSVLEVPSIVGEDTYKALKECAEALLAAFPPGTPPGDLNLVAVDDAIMSCEAVIMMNTLFADHLAKPQTMTYPYYQAYPKRQLPPNKAIVDPLPNGFDPANTGAHSSDGIIGIIDTLQNPVACKLLADLDYIAVQAGLRDGGG
jgi:hypothetical protein